MGFSHALFGAAAWLAGSWLLNHYQHVHQTPVQIAVGTALCAGGALLPDLDMSGKVTSCQGGAVVAHTFGVVSLFVAECVEKVSLGVYRLTRGRRDPVLHNGHRTLTHTLLFNVAAGWVVWWLCARYGRWAILAALFIALACALRGLFEGWSHRAGWLVVTLTAAAGSVAAYLFLPAAGAGLLGAALGVGGVVHLLGDALTEHACPLLWPLPIAGRRWYPLGPPKILRFHTNGRVERWLVRPVFAAVGVVAVAALAIL